MTHRQRTALNCVLKSRTVRLALLAALLSGCSSTEIILANPATGATAHCQASVNDYMNPGAAAESCAKGYESLGFKRVSSY